MGWIAAAIAAAGAIGGAGLSAYGTSQAQSDANSAAAQAAAQQGAGSFQNYLTSRGVNLSQIIANDPRGPEFWNSEYAKARAAGDKRDFNTWLVAAIQAAPSDPIWQAISSPTVGNGASNTTLPAWAVDAQGNPLQPALLQQILGIANGPTNPATAPIGSIATVQTVRDFYTANPLVRQAIVDNMAGSSDTRTPEQWLVDHITQTEAQSGGGTFTDLLRNYAANKAAGGDGLVTGPGQGSDAFSALPQTAPTPAPGSSSAPAGPAGTGNNTTLDPALAALIPQATTAAGGIFDGTFLGQLQAALQPVAAARTAEADAQGRRVEELRAGSGNLLNTTNTGLDALLAARTAGAGNIYDATLQGAGGLRDATTAAGQNIFDTNISRLADLLRTRTTAAGNIYDTTIQGATGIRDASSQAAQDVNAANVTKLAALLGVRREAAQQLYDASIGSATGVRDARTSGAQNIYGAELTQADTYAQAARQAMQRLLAQESANRLRQGFGTGGSGSDITRARIMAEAIQQGAGARAGAGVNLQNRLAQAGIGYAQDTGSAGIGRAEQLGRAADLDAQAQLQAAVQLAQSLGLANTDFARSSSLAGIDKTTSIGRAQEADSAAQLAAALQLAQTLGQANIGYAGTVGNAGIGRATTLAGAGEADKVARLQAAMDDAQRRLGYLTSDADIARAQADFQNAQDQLNAIVANQNRMVGSLGVPYQLANSDLALKNQLSGQGYSGIDQLLQRLAQFNVGQASGPTTVTSTPQPTLNGSQIAGGLLSGLGSAASSYASNQQLLQLIAGMNNRAGVGAPTTYDQFVQQNPTSSAALGGGSIFTPVQTNWNLTPTS